MIAPTLAVAVLASLGAATLRPGRALGVVLMSLLLWPEYLRLPMGLAQMSAPRIAAMVLMARLIVAGRLHQTRPRLIDGLVVFAWAWDIAAAAIAGADQTQLVYLVGRGFDTVLMYGVARLALISAADFRGLILPLALSAVALGSLGVMEAVTSSSPYQRLFAHHQWNWYDKAPEYRLGLLRARGSTAHPIYFGMTMCIVAGLLIALRGVARSVWAWAPGAACALAGAAASLSSGPAIAVSLLLLCSALLYARWLIRPALLGAAALAVFLELASNRHFYDLIDYLALNSGTSWYRSRLIEVAVSNLHEYWMFGYGSRWPHHWGMLIDRRGHVDIVNHYVIVAITGGVLSLVAYVAVLALALRDCVRHFRTAPEQARTLLFGQGALLVALAAASMSVGLYGPPLILTYILLGSMVRAGHAAHQTGMNTSTAPARPCPFPMPGQSRIGAVRGA